MFDVLSTIPSGLAALNGLGILYLVIGTSLGFIFGSLPGLGGIAALALLIPFSWGMDPRHAMLLFSGSMGAIAFGGSVSAILLNVPGTPQNIATAFDGFPLSQKGKAGTAIGTAAAASALGALFGLVVLILLLPVLRAIILHFGPPEFLMLILFGLVAIPLFTGRNFIAGMISGGLGLTMSFVGFSGTTGVLRYNFGTLYLYDGIQLIPVVMGLFAVAQAIELLSSGDMAVSRVPDTRHRFSDVLEGVKMVFKYKVTFFRSSIMGVLIGIIPGMGGVIANTFSWITAAQSSPRKEYFGTGEVEGIIASEAANDSKDGGALLPTLAFGIPGSGEMAVLMGAFILHGIAPGPQLLRNNMDIAWAIILGMILSNLLVAVMGVVFARHMARLTSVKGNNIAPIIVCASLIGALAMRNEPIDMYVTLLFGFIGYVIERYGFSKITLILGFILGYLAEISLSQSLMISDNSLMIFVKRPISLGLLILLIFLILLVGIILPLKKKKVRATTIDKKKVSEKKEAVETGHKRPVNWKDLGIYFNILLIIWFILILAIGWSYPLRAKIFPMAVAALSILLTFGTFLSYFSEKIRKIIGSLAGSQLFDISAAKDIGHDIVKVEKRELTLLNLLFIFLWFAGAGILIYLLGYLIGIAIFLFTFLKFYVRHSLKMCLLMTGVTAFATWFIFSFFLEIPYLSVLFM